MQTNSSGFRSDIDYEPQKGSRPRILFFGDSMTAGDGCNNHERFSDQLGRLLGAETYNYGLSGSGTDQQLLILENFALDVEADLIILCVYVENVQRNMAQVRPTIDRATGSTVLVPKPFFRMGDEGLELHGTPVPLQRQVVPSSQRKANHTSTILTAAALLANRLRDSPALRKALGPLLSTKTSDHFRVRSLLPRLMGFQPLPEYDSPNGDACRLLAALIKRFKQSCATIPLLVVPIPSVDHVLGRARANFQPFFTSLESLDHGLHVADCFAYLRTLPHRERTRLSFDYDCHYSPRGHSVVAQFLCNTILNRGLLTQSSSATPAPAKAQVQASYILGLSCFYHNSAACLLRNGEIVAAAEEERFSRVKNDRRFPTQAVNYCLEEAGIDTRELESVVFYDDPYLTFERIIATVAESKAASRDMWLRMAPSWACFKLGIPQLIRQHLHYNGPVYKDLHHRAHAASAFFPSPFERAAILTIDGVGEWTTASIARGEGNTIVPMKEMRFPHSLGLLYSAFTQFLGFKVNSGEYKMMGLAPYGEPKYVDQILAHVVDLAQDGSLRLRMEMFSFLTGQTMVGDGFAKLFGPPRCSEGAITQRDLDLARSVQAVTEMAVLRMAQHAHEITGEESLCLAGGVALNCVANGRILREGPFKNIWIQPAAGDAGAALGAALDIWHMAGGKHRHVRANSQDAQQGSLLGPAYREEEIAAFLESRGIPHVKLERGERARAVAELLAAGKVTGHFSGRMEFGPRALGSRSILGDARNKQMQSVLNLKIKYRESFRPFAPAVLEELADSYFELDRPSPYMLIVAPVHEARRLPFTLAPDKDVLEIVRQPRSDVPAITHVDYSARIQTVGTESNRSCREILEAFHKLTGCGLLVNTSFNVRGEPIVNTPEEAYRCFMRTEMDALLLEDFLLLKQEQPAWEETLAEAAPVANLHGASFLRELERIFDEEVLPAASRLDSPLKLTDKPPLPSGWSNWNAELPLPFLESKNDPEHTAQEISAAWDNRALAEHFTPVLIRLLKAGQRERELGDNFESVPNNTYVMF
ncbi:MAG: carbamoyltransferase N-terminal domain-containing protein [Pseudomonadota bacterium]